MLPLDLISLKERQQILNKETKNSITKTITDNLHKIDKLNCTLLDEDLSKAKILLISLGEKEVINFLKSKDTRFLLHLLYHVCVLDSKLENISLQSVTNHKNRDVLRFGEYSIAIEFIEDLAFDFRFEIPLREFRVNRKTKSIILKLIGSAYGIYTTGRSECRSDIVLNYCHGYLSDKNLAFLFLVYWIRRCYCPRKCASRYIRHCYCHYGLRPSSDYCLFYLFMLDFLSYRYAILPLDSSLVFTKYSAPYTESLKELSREDVIYLLNAINLRSKKVKIKDKIFLKEVKHRI